MNWFDPAIDMTHDTAAPMATDGQPDVGDPEDSAPAASGVHLALAGVLALPVLAVGAVPWPGPGSPLRGRSLRVPLPPPRWTLAAA